MKRMILAFILLVTGLTACQTIPPFIDEADLPDLKREEFLRIRTLEDKVLRDYESRQESLQMKEDALQELKVAEKANDDSRAEALEDRVEYLDLLIKVRLASMKHSISELEAEKARALSDHGMLGDRPPLTEYHEYRDTLADEVRLLKEELEAKEKEKTTPTRGGEK